MVPSKSALRAAVAEEADDAGIAAWVAETLLEDPESRPVTDFSPDYRDHVRSDRELLCRIRDRLALLDATSDPKLTSLVDILESCPSAKGRGVRHLCRHGPIPGRAPGC
ncbi:MAG: hypothetical protein ACRDWV_04370 [Acidimicrobiales bacterium]